MKGDRPVAEGAYSFVLRDVQRRVHLERSPPPTRGAQYNMTTATITTRSTSDERLNAEVLLWQSQVRYGVALFVIMLSALLQFRGVLPRAAVSPIVLYGSYAIAIALLCEVIKRTQKASPPIVLATIGADVLVLFFGASVLAPPEDNERVLIIAFMVIHAAEFNFGRRYALVALSASAVGYVALTYKAITAGFPLEWSQELWSVALFSIVAGGFIFHYGSFHLRLSRIVALFDRAEDGDFSAAYDVAVDKRPDGITALGRSYNRLRSQLATMVLTDPLSGCLNRRGLEGELKREIAHSVREKTELALVTLDIDNFKRVNDCFGHLAGDHVIREIGALLLAEARRMDVVSRVGGDEFAVLLPGTGAPGAVQLANRIRSSVARRTFEGISIPITVSIGVVADIAADANVAEALHARADEALYSAKGAGRDRVSVWSPGTRGATGLALL